MKEQPPILVVGCGNPFGGDDAVGVLVTRMLMPIAGVDFIEAPAHPGELAAAMRHRKVVLIIDAALTDRFAEGNVLELDPLTSPCILSQSRWSSHGWTIEQELELARAMGDWPELVRIFAIAIARPPRPGPMSDGLERALPEAASHIAAWLYSRIPDIERPEGGCIC